MRMMVIGASGNLGKRIVSEAKKTLEVTAVCRREIGTEGVRILRKSLFDLTAEDIADTDIIVSTYGAGFDADPSLNYKAIMHLRNLVSGTAKKMVVVGGSGCLLNEDNRYSHLDESYPKFLLGISENLTKAYEELKKDKVTRWVFVCPPLTLSLDTASTGSCLLTTDGHIPFNKAHESCISYDDMGKAMVEIAMDDKYTGHIVSACRK